ncbi:helix-turn-helix domain-containing protein [Henriciella sp.]|uniref:helix-turn-helix domain-containing protein n=1 Tax=Henriciella sp. TaxID=1968823 RepID=UPI002630D70E|nr:AraC family transcriptional regulator [Henriciella sp.]
MQEDYILSSASDFDGYEIRLKDARGRMERRVFSNGITLHRSEFHTTRETLMDFGSEPPGWVTLTFHLSGCSLFEADDNSQHWARPNEALLWRCDSSAKQVRIPGNQVIRHVGVAIFARDLEPRLGGDVPDALLPFMRPSVPNVMAQTFETDQAIKDCLTAIHGEAVSTPLSDLSMEGYATQLLGLSLKRLMPVPGAGEGLTVWENDALTWLDRHLSEAPDRPVDTAQLASKVGLSEKRLKQLFRERTGTTIAEQLKTIRMRSAQQALETTDLPVKQIAANAGYGHVTNFSRAYTRWFGEPPAQTRRKNKALS